MKLEFGGMDEAGHPNGKEGSRRRVRSDCVQEVAKKVVFVHEHDLVTRQGGGAWRSKGLGVARPMGWRVKQDLIRHSVARKLSPAKESPWLRALPVRNGGTRPSLVKGGSAGGCRSHQPTLQSSTSREAPPRAESMHKGAPSGSVG